MLRSVASAAAQQVIPLETSWRLQQGLGHAAQTALLRAFAAVPAEELAQPVAAPPFTPRAEEASQGDAHVPEGAKIQGPGAHMLAKYRSTYPASVFSEISSLFPVNTLNTRTCVDVGIGTGRGAIDMAKRGFKVTAIDVTASLLAQTQDMARQCRVRVNSLSAKAAQTKLADGIADVVTVMHGLHLVDLTRALQESRRLLRVKGYLCAAWNDRDLEDPFVEQLEELIESHNPAYQRLQKQRSPEQWQQHLEQDGMFALASYTVHDNPLQLRNVHAAIELMEGLPYIRAALDADKKHEFSKALTALVEQHFGSKSQFAYPLQTKLYILRRGVT